MAMRRWVGLLVWIGLVACQSAAALPRSAVTPLPTLGEPSFIAVTASPLAAPTPVTGWVALAAGLDRREFTVPFSSGFAERLVFFRIDPHFYQFHVAYAPGQPALVSQWAPEASLVFNAGFFDENNVALGLVVSQGQTYGQSYAGFGGMFSMVSGQPDLRSLVDVPYQAGELLDEAVQGFPMLLRRDGTLYAQEDANPARRTVVALDDSGRVVVGFATWGGLTLAQLATWLRDSGLGLSIALNLDGGGSTGYWAGPLDNVDSLSPVPAVIVVTALHLP